jgi:ABC-type transport system involved in multi-copper enzyme maturation permease subunit
MLGYKAWRESRTRCLLSAATLGWFCSVLIVFRPMMATAAQIAYARFVETSIYEGSIRNFFVIFAVVLGLGGLMQEAERGCAPFTLSLPATRVRHVSARALVGLAEVFGLALLPSGLVLALAPFVHESYPVGVALQHSLRWTLVGLPCFALSFLMSIVLSGTYAALIASWVLLIACGIVVLALPVGVPAAVGIIPAIVMIGAGAWLTDRQDF